MLGLISQVRSRTKSVICDILLTERLSAVCEARVSMSRKQERKDRGKTEDLPTIVERPNIHQPLYSDFWIGLSPGFPQELAVGLSHSATPE